MLKEHLVPVSYTHLDVYKRQVYPTVSTRLALSEKDGEHPYALLYREGLMPYAEIAVGRKRLVHAVRMAAVLSLGSSAVSALLAFYLTFVGAYSALTPVSMLLYLLLWALAALIEGFWACLLYTSPPPS